MGAYYLNVSAAQNSVVLRCLTYMSFPCFATGCSYNEALLARKQKWPSLPYIAETLFSYLHYVDLDGNLQFALRRFFATHRSPRGGNFGSWAEAFVPEARDNTRNSTPLYYAARFGLVHLVNWILDTDDRSALELRGGRHNSTFLRVTSRASQAEVVRMLLQAGASVKETGKYGSVWARLCRYTAIERMLKMLVLLVIT